LLKNKDNLSASVIIIFIVVSAVRQNCHQRQTVKKHAQSFQQIY
jgi:hypothetical protein